MSIKKGELNISTSQDYKFFVSKKEESVKVTKIKLEKGDTKVTLSGTPTLSSTFANNEIAILSLNDGGDQDGYYVVTSHATTNTLTILQGLDFESVTGEITMVSTASTNAKLIRFGNYSRVLRSFKVPGFESEETDITTTTDKEKVTAVTGSKYEDLSITVLVTESDPLFNDLRTSAHIKNNLGFLVTSGKRVFAYIGTIKNKPSIDIDNGNTPVESSFTATVQFGFEGVKA